MSTTRHFGLAIPRRHVLSFASEVSAALGDQVEALGHEAHIIIRPAAPVEVNEQLRLTAADEADSALPVQVIATADADADEETLATMIGMVVGSSINDDDTDGEATDAAAGKPVSPTLTGAFHTGPEYVQIVDGQLIHNPTGYVVGASRAFFDGTSPLAIHPTLASYQALANPTQSIVWNDTEKRLVMEVSTSGTVTIRWPFTMPSDWQSWHAESTDAIWCWLKLVSGTVTATPRLIDTNAVSHAGVAAALGAGWTRLGLTIAELSGAAGRPSDPIALEVELAATGASVIRVDATALAVYEGRRRYG